MKTKSEIFKAAHKLAKTFEGNYTACFVLALSEVRNNLKLNNMTNLNLSSITKSYLEKTFGNLNNVKGSIILTKGHNSEKYCSEFIIVDITEESIVCDRQITASGNTMGINRFAAAIENKMLNLKQ